MARAVYCHDYKLNGDEYVAIGHLCEICIAPAEGVSELIGDLN